jgi:hypothetical protein
MFHSGGRIQLSNLNKLIRSIGGDIESPIFVERYYEFVVEIEPTLALIYGDSFRQISRIPYPHGAWNLQNLLKSAKLAGLVLIDGLISELENTTGMS